jgi:hypothetical protein
MLKVCAQCHSTTVLPGASSAGQSAHGGGLALADGSASKLSSGGASRDRTDDPLLAKQVLSQLSYGPMIGPERPKIPWWVWEDSNLRPHPYQGCALTT